MSDVDIDGSGSDQGPVEFPSFIEEAICQIAHHSTWSLETLVALILDKFTQSYLPGERVLIEGKKGTFKVVGQNSNTGEYVVQPASGGAKVKGIKAKEIKRPADSEVDLVTPQSIISWLDFSADVRDIPDDPEAECLWRIKKHLRRNYNLVGKVPQKFASTVKFPVEHDDDSEEDNYQPSDVSNGQIEELERDSAVETRRKKRQSVAQPSGQESCIAADLQTLKFDGEPMKDGILMFLLESAKDAEERMSSNDDKIAVFKVLKTVDHNGLSVDEIVSCMKENGCIVPEETPKAREHVFRICTSDAAFFRCASSKFCLSAVIADIVAKELFNIFQQYSDGSDLTQLKDKNTSQIFKIEARQVDCLKRLADQCSRQVASRNAKCPKCHRLVKPEKASSSSLRDCNTCPRVYHQDCLDESEISVDAQYWSCMKCIETAQGIVRRMIEYEERKKAIKAKSHRGRDEGQKRNNSKRNGQNVIEKEVQRAPRRKVTDWEAVEEEKMSIIAIKERLKNLHDTAEIIDGDEQLVSLKSAEIEKAKQELARVEAMIEGPPKNYPLLFKSDESFAIFNEASGVSEFLALYGDICELEEIFDTPDLLFSTKWPLDHSGSLVPLYSQLLLCCLLEQLNRDAPMKSRARKWTRILTNSTWPEVLRRYIKVTRVPTEKELEEGVYEPIADLKSPPRGLYSDDFSKLKDEVCKYLETKGWWEMPVSLQLSLLHALCYDISQGYTLKADMGNKIQDCARISTDFGKLLIQARKLRREKLAEDRKKKQPDALDNGSDDDEENDYDDDLEDDINMNIQEKEQEAEEMLRERSFRTNCLGIDRYGRRYWWLRGAPSGIMIEDDHGKHAGYLKSREELDSLMRSLLRKGPREGNLLRTIRRFYKRLCASFSDEGCNSLLIESIERPVPTDGRQKQKSLDALASQITSDTLKEAKLKIDDVLSELATSKIELAADLKGYRVDLRSLETPKDVCKFMLHLESILCTAGEGLPPYASTEEMETFLGNEYASKLPPIVFMEHQNKKLDHYDDMHNEGHDVKTETVKSETDGDDGTARSEGDDEVDHITALIQENPLNKALKPFIVRPTPISDDDDFDCSDAEHTYLREKRMRKPARLWRSGRERSIWLKGVLNASEAPPDVGAAKTTFYAYILGDRVNLLIDRCLALEKEIARWEAEEEERKQAEIQLAREKSEKLQQPGERPMMIRTGKAKTDSGVKVVLKLIGREPFPQGRNATTAMDIMASDEEISKCRWGYQCSVCLLAGDLICCEHPDGCAVSVHEDCSGQGFPKGKWICSNHDESNLKTRVRKRAEQSNDDKAPGGARKSFVEPDPLADVFSSDDEYQKRVPNKKRRKNSSSTETSEQSSSSETESDY